MDKSMKKSEIKDQISSRKKCEELNLVTSVWGNAAEPSLNKVFLHIRRKYYVAKTKIHLFLKLSVKPELCQLQSKKILFIL